MATQRFQFPLPDELRASRSAPALLPVLKPQLPLAANLLPYLEQIDQRRWYTNAGPLVTRLEERLSRRIGFENAGAVTAANATVAMTVALLARRIPAGSLCIVPSWTFVATPHAVRAAGLIPWFHDVDRRTWALNPDEVEETLRHANQPVAALVVVSPFGAPLNLESWQKFEDRTGIRVVVDAAAGFDTVRPSGIPLVVSLHATKILGAGEGGFVCSTDTRFLERFRAGCNFGFQGERIAMLPALNAKMSEYHAAVGLASLEQWRETRQQHARIMAWYREILPHVDRVSLQPGYGNGWVSATTSVILPAKSLSRIAAQLRAAGVESKTWWGEGCHCQPAFIDCPRTGLPVTEELGSRVLGLPHFPEMQRQDVERVSATLADAVTAEHHAAAREHRRSA
ncbi:MAG TPA: aminotransferase class I/II-fold pyridoxal phosphate-dependent enzyme [Bryobacteraceae bacterium]|nr:aminotransferase class I/II-fold pyridoxal phosphate-dependent enzyme [Bryobacteraceae bacterium]